MIYFLASGGLLAVIVVAGAMLQVGNPFEWYGNSIGFRPSSQATLTIFGLGLISCVALGLFLITLKTVEDEYASFGQELEDKGAPVTPPAITDEKDQNQRIREYYLKQGYVVTSNSLLEKPHENSVAPEKTAELLAKEPQLDISGVWRRRAVLIYEDGSFSSFQIAVLYSDESWQKGSSLHLQQKRRGRPVHILKAIEQPFLNSMLTKTDYAICFGLASAEPTATPEQNEKLADDRAWHCGSAIVTLGYQKRSRVRSFSLGYALDNVESAEIRSRQRSLVIVGIDTSDRPDVEDVVFAIGELVTLTGVNFRRYSRSHPKHTQFFSIPPDSFDGTDHVSELLEDNPDLRVLTPLADAD